MVMNIAVCSSTGWPLAITFSAKPTLGGVSEMHGAGPAGVANGHGVIGWALMTSASVSTGIPPTTTVGALLGASWNVPPCEHWMIAPWLRIGGTDREYRVRTAARSTTRQNDVAMADSLRGKLILASPALQDPNFARTVVLIAEHTDEGAMGLVLNRPALTTVAEAVPDLTWLTGEEDLVYVGGPVAETAVIVLAEFSQPELAGALVEDDLGFVGADADDPERLDGAIRRARVFAGHAGWGPGQLEDELAEEAWIVEPPTRGEIFTDAPDDLWAAVLRRKGRRYALLATMPPDPSLN
jgi:putative transcriptional regulator